MRDKQFEPSILFEIYEQYRRIDSVPTHYHYHQLYMVRNRHTHKMVTKVDTNTMLNKQTKTLLHLRDKK